MILVKNFRKKLKNKENASGIPPEPMEIDRNLEKIEIIEASEIELQADNKTGKKTSHGEVVRDAIRWNMPEKEVEENWQ